MVLLLLAERIVLEATSRKVPPDRRWLRLSTMAGLQAW